MTLRTITQDSIQYVSGLIDIAVSEFCLGLRHHCPRVRLGLNCFGRRWPWRHNGVLVWRQKNRLGFPRQQYNSDHKQTNHDHGQNDDRRCANARLLTLRQKRRCISAWKLNRPLACWTLYYFTHYVRWRFQELLAVWTFELEFSHFENSILGNCTEHITVSQPAERVQNTVRLLVGIPLSSPCV